MTATLTPAARQLPWDAMGGALSTKAKTVAAALKEKGLDYTVERRFASAGSRLVADAPDGSDTHRKSLHTEDFQALVRPMPDGSEKVLAFTKKRYTPIQNRNAFKLADHLVAEWGATISGAADFRNGDRCLMAVTLPETINLVGRDGNADPVSLNLLIVNDLAANGALALALTPIRIPCTNALPAALRGAERVWKIHHTPNGQVRLDLAADAIRHSLEYRDAFQEQAQAMMDQTMVDAEFQKMVAKLYPVKKDAEGVAAERRRATQAQLLDLWKTSPTMDGIRGTRWAGYNTVTEFLDHYRPVRGEATVARAEGSLEGPYVRQKAALWNMFANA